MAPYRKKPVVVDAVRCTSPEVIKTLEGDMQANPGDWIVTGVHNERYPVKNEIFEATYVAAGGPEDLVPQVWCGCGDSIEPDDEALCGNCAMVMRAQRDGAMSINVRSRRDQEQARTDPSKR